MGEIVSLATYPLTGARAVETDSAMVGPGGMDGDRLFVPYDEVKGIRVSQAQVPALARITAVYDGDALRLSHDADSQSVPYVSYGTEVTVDEFGDPTPVWDAGSDAAAFLGRTTNRWLRLGQKTDHWAEGGDILPEDRANAPLHIVNRASVLALRSMLPNASFDSDRFRGNVVVDGEDPFSELSWVGRFVQMGGLLVKITRATERCNVPARDQQTGENMKDVPLLYPRLAKGKRGKPLLGVYGVPVLRGDVRRQPVAKGDPVRLVNEART